MNERTSKLLLLGAGILVVALGMFVLFGVGRPVEQSATEPEATIVVGEPGGAVIPTATPRPTAAATPATPEPALTPAPPSPTPAPVPASTPAPAGTPSMQPTPPTPAPTAVVVGVAQPEDTVAAFYRNVAAGNFDAAYALWSDRMKATYPRAENLDGRFDETASIQFTQLHVAQRGGMSATVQANFIETYDSGGTREFIGYWELVQVNGRWLLDAPHY